MKKLLLILSLFPTLIYAQCSYEDIIVFEHGITKFDAITVSKTNPGFQESKSNKAVIGKWFNMSYSSDSVFKDTFSFEVSNIQCYKSYPCFYTLLFADDKLYQQHIEIEFNSFSYDDYREIYRKMIQLFRLEYNHSNMVDITQPGTNTKIGEGYSFSDYDTLQDKVKEVRVFNRILYKRDKETGADTNEIEKYTITVESTDLKATKLDRRGY